MQQNANICISKKEINWSLDENGIMIFEGRGKIPDYDCGNNPSAPWKNVNDRITEIHIMEGITEIGINTFRDCENLKKVVLPDSLRRIHAYAFWNCKKLVCIESDRIDFKYVYDDRSYKKDNTVIFGIESFHNVPWCKSRWGDFYCNEDMLYVTFAGESKELVIPKGIRVLKTFSMNFLDVDSILLPDTLAVIENFVFSDSTIKKHLTLPDSIETISPFAFADCSISLIRFPFSWKPDKIRWKRTESEMIRGQKTPKSINKFSVSLLENKCFGKFRKMRITENKEIHHRDGTVTKVRDSDVIDVGSSIYRRIRNGRVVLCVAHENNRIISVKSFAWDRYYKIPNEYLMYPVLDKDGELLPWRDSFTYQEKEDIVCAFDSFDGAALKNAEVLRFLYSDIQEEWFWSDDRDNFGGALEIDFLNMWLAMHPEMTVDSAKENIENDKTRWFVSV